MKAFFLIKKQGDLNKLNNIFQVLKEKNYHPQFYIQQKHPAKWRENKTFSDDETEWENLSPADLCFKNG